MKKMKQLFILATIGIVVSTQLFAQPAECTGRMDPPLPKMFVSQKKADERKFEFALIPKSKYNAILNVNDKQDLQLFYSADAFKTLLNKINSEKGIRIYFANYSQADGVRLPEKIGNKHLILLFATEFSNQRMPEKYYFLNHTGLGDVEYEIDSAVANKWINNYKRDVLPELSKDLPKVPDNIDRHDPNKTYTDTKSIFFSIDDINEAIDTEVTYQLRTQKVNIKGYMLSFAAYTEKGNDTAGYKHRMLLQFDYLDENGNIVDQEKQPWIKCRQAATAKRLAIENKKAKAQEAAEKKNKNLINSPKEKSSLNKGLLCPTNCPPRPS